MHTIFVGEVGGGVKPTPLPKWEGGWLCDGGNVFSRQSFG